MSHRITRVVPVLVLTATAIGCGSDARSDATVATTPPASASSTELLELNDADTGTDELEELEELYPDVIDATAEFDGTSWTFSATLSSPYDSPERYADAWRVVGPDGTVYGERILTHDHATEQPFTRSTSGVAIPAGVDEVTIEGRDQLSGWGGDTVTIALER